MKCQKLIGTIRRQEQLQAASSNIETEQKDLLVDRNYPVPESTRQPRIQWMMNQE